MKRIITLLMAALLSISLCSCGENSSSSNNTRTSEDVSAETSIEKTEQNTPETEQKF